MKEKNELSYRDLKMICNQDMFKFDTTQELEPINDGIGQERGIKAFTLNDSVFFTIALLNNFKFQYLTITDTAKVCNVLFDYDAETVRKRMHDFRKEKNEQSDFNPKVNQQINGLIKKVEHLLGTGRDNQAKLKELKEWLYSNVMSKNNLWNEDTKE